MEAALAAWLVPVGRGVCALATVGGGVATVEAVVGAASVVVVVVEAGPATVVVVVLATVEVVVGCGDDAWADPTTKPEVLTTAPVAVTAAASLLTTPRLLRRLRPPDSDTSAQQRTRSAHGAHMSEWSSRDTATGKAPIRGMPV